MEVKSIPSKKQEDAFKKVVKAMKVAQKAETDDEEEISEQPPRCDFEKHVEDYFGFTTEVTENEEVKVDFGTLVDLVATFKPSVSHLKDNREQETLSAKLRNLLSPIYGLADLILLHEDFADSTLLNSIRDTAKLAIDNKPLIDAILTRFDQPSQPYKELSEINRKTH